MSHLRTLCFTLAPLLCTLTFSSLALAQATVNATVQMVTTTEGEAFFGTDDSISAVSDVKIVNNFTDSTEFSVEIRIYSEDGVLASSFTFVTIAEGATVEHVLTSVLVGPAALQLADECWGTLTVKRKINGTYQPFLSRAPFCWMRGS